MSDMSQMFDVAESDNMVCWSVITTFTNVGRHTIQKDGSDQNYNYMKRGWRISDGLMLRGFFFSKINIFSLGYLDGKSGLLEVGGLTMFNAFKRMFQPGV